MGRENHFVSQFYLRRFSSDGRRTNLFNFASKKTIEGASIKHQASRRGFYDFNPEIEAALSGLEGEIAQLLRAIDSSEKLPANDMPADIALKFFILMQRVRTEAAGQLAETVSDYFSPLWLQAHPKIRESAIDTSGLVIRTKYPHALPMQVMAEHAYLVREFRLHLFLNRTKYPFITSDNPAIAHNKYCEGIGNVGVLGLQSPGYLCLWPISPGALIMMYDADVYSIGEFRRDVVSIISNLEEIKNLNEFQMLGANKNIYFGSIIDSSEITSCSLRLESLRASKRTAFVRTDRVERPDGTTSELIATHQIMLPIKLATSGVAIRRQKRKVPLSERPNLDLRPRESRRGEQDSSVRYRVRSVDER
jgi:hypothetical protein